MKRRLAFFVLLGPFLSWLIFLAMLSPKLLTGPRFEGGLSFFAIALGICYFPGILFFLAAAGLDHGLSRFQAALRVGLLAVVGFGVAFTLFYVLSRGGPEKDFQQYWFFLGLMGAVPLAVCSWLSSRSQTAQ